jgi:ribosomal protein L19
MIFHVQRKLLNKRRFISFVKYRKCKRRRFARIIRIVKNKFRLGVFKDFKKKLYNTLFYRNPRKRIRIVPRIFFFKNRISFKSICSQHFNLYFSDTGFPTFLKEQIRNIRLGDRICIQVSRHMNLSDLSFFDDFFSDLYCGILINLKRNGTSSVAGIRQNYHNVNIFHYFSLYSPNVILLERVRA